MTLSRRDTSDFHCHNPAKHTAWGSIYSISLHESISLSLVGCVNTHAVEVTSGQCLTSARVQLRTCPQALTRSVTHASSHLLLGSTSTAPPLARRPRQEAAAVPAGDRPGRRHHDPAQQGNTAVLPATARGSGASRAQAALGQWHCRPAAVPTAKARAS